MRLIARSEFRVRRRGATCVGYDTGEIEQEKADAHDEAGHHHDRLNPANVPAGEDRAEPRERRLVDGDECPGGNLAERFHCISGREARNELISREGLARASPLLFPCNVAQGKPTRGVTGISARFDHFHVATSKQGCEFRFC